MFAGPGSGPLIAAATAWGELAEELLASIASLGSVTSELTSGAWLGPSAAAMMAVATQYLAWLSTAAAQAEQAAAQAMAIATAFEAALAATVQPAVVAANRGLMQLLAATNWFGQNAPALMDVEAAYEQMWALDVAAMAGYHFDASAAVAQLAPWQQVLRNLGIDIGKNGQINLGFGNTGSGNIGIGNSGSLNSGIGTSGTINAGLGSAGSLNTSFWNAGMQNAALGSAAGSEAALVSSAGYATGGMSTAALSSGILASALGSTGGLQHGLANVLNSGLTNTPVAAPASAPVGGLDSGNPNPGSGSAAAGSGANPGLRSPGTSYPSFVNSGSNDSGLRNTAVREPSTPRLRHPQVELLPEPRPRIRLRQPADRQPVGSE